MIQIAALVNASGNKGDFQGDSDLKNLSKGFL